MRHFHLSVLLIALLAGCSSPKAPDYVVGAGARQGREEAEKTFAEAVPKLSTGARPLDKPLKVISSPFPDYPRSFRNAGIVGVVKTVFQVGEDGTVSNPTVVGSPPPGLVAISLHAIMRWRFEPPMRDGKPVRVTAVQEFSFVVE